MKLNEVQRDLLEQYFDYEVSDDCRLRTDYSGRCMYGNKCIGIVAKNPVDIIVGLVIFLMEHDEEDLAKKFVGSRSDNMGLDMIQYFPAIEWGIESSVEDVEEDDEEDDMDDVAKEDLRKRFELFKRGS